MKRIGIAIAAGFAVAGLFTACTREQSSFVDRPHSGTPAYWESQAPTPTPTPQQKTAPQAKPDAGTYFPEWPSLDGGVSPDPGPHTMNGTTDPYLWEKGSGTELTPRPAVARATPPDAPSQEPMRGYDGADATDGVESYTIVGSQPPVRSDDPYADAADAGTDSGADAAAPEPVPAKTNGAAEEPDPYPVDDGMFP